MTREEWLRSEDPVGMLAYLIGRRGSLGLSPAGDRQLRLFAVACCRALGWRGEAIDAAERWAETGAPCDPPEGVKLGGQTWCYYPDAADAAHEWAACISVLSSAERAALLREVAGDPFAPPAWSDSWAPRHAWDMAGAAYDERLPDGTLDPLRLAILADALEEAGCAETSEQAIPNVYVCERCGITSYLLPSDYRQCAGCHSDYVRKHRLRDLPHPLLAHLRSPGPHVRGCWALDLVLGKE